MIIGIFLGFILGVVVFFILGVFCCKKATEDDILEGVRFWKDWPDSMKWGRSKD